MNEVLKNIKERRSIRKYKDKVIPEEVLNELKEAIVWAPSACHYQARRFYFVFDEKTRQALSNAAYGQKHVAEAPLVAVGCIDLDKFGQRQEMGGRLYGICDVSASMQNLMLAAKAAGLGTCWIGAFKPAEVIKILNLPNNLEPVAMTPIGYADNEPIAPERIEIDKAVIDVK